MERNNILDFENKQRVLKHVKQHLGIESMEELHFLLEHIPEESREIFNSRWGLDGTMFCVNFTLLNKKLKIADTQFLYIQAMEQLANLVIFKQEGEITEQLFCAMTNLVNAILGERKDGEPPRIVDAKELIWLVNSRLKMVEKRVIFSRFGLVDGKVILAEKLAEEMDLQEQHMEYKTVEH